MCPLLKVAFWEPVYTDIIAEGRDGGIYRGDGRVNVFLDKAGACTAKGVRAVRLCCECPGTSGGLDVVHFHTHAEVVRLPSKRSAPKKRAGVSGADGTREFAPLAGPRIVSVHLYANFDAPGHFFPHSHDTFIARTVDKVH